MGTGAYMKITNNRSGAVTVAVSKVNCMYWDDSSNGSNLSLFDNATIQPGQALPSGNPQYLESDSSGVKCVAEDSVFYLTFKDAAGNVIGSSFHLSESDFTWQTWNDVDENFFNVSCVPNSSGKQFDITVDILVDPYPPGTVVNQWILSSQNRAADVWYNKDFTVYGLNTAAGIPAPGSSNLVSVRDQGNGDLALQCGQNYNAYASVRDEHNYQVGFQFVNPPDQAGWITQIRDNEILQAVPTGDGYFALYSPHFSRYIQINPQKNGYASCNALMATGTTDISTAAKFSAAGQQHNCVLDLVQLSKSAAGMSFAGVDLTGQDLSGANLTGCDFTQAVSVGSATFTGANLTNAEFGPAHLDLVKLSGANCTGADFTGATLTASATPASMPVLSGATLKNAQIQGTLAGANLESAILDGATLSSSLNAATMTGVSLTDATISSTATLTGAIMNGAGLMNATIAGNLSTANLTNATLISATIAGNLSGANLTSANLTSAVVAGANLTGADLTSATLTGVNLGATPLPTLTGANLTEADLSKATLAGANLSGATLAGTNFKGQNLSQVTFSSPLLQSTTAAVPTVFAGCTLPYSVIGLNWSCLDLTDAVLTGVPTNLAQLNAANVLRPSANFTGFTLDGANFTEATLTNAQFTNASLREQVNFKGAVLTGAVFSHAVLDQASFESAALGGVALNEATQFSYAYVSNCDFTEANMQGVIFTGATLVSANVFQAKTPGLLEADFSNAYLPDADFTGGTLQGARFDGAFMVGCVLSNADLSPAKQGSIAASLGGACLQGAALDGTILTGANLDNAAITDVRGMITQQYYGEDGQLTPAVPMHYQASPFPVATSFSGGTVCPNGRTYAVNQGNSLTIAQMMVATNPPTSWEPRNTTGGKSGPPGNTGQPPPRNGLAVHRVTAEIRRLIAWIRQRL